MTKRDDGPLRGDAAWQAAKAEMAQRNDAARASGGKQRAATEEAKLARIRADDARERDHLPEQPRD
jgi:hypothetical protein